MAIVVRVKPQPAPPPPPRVHTTPGWWEGSIRVIWHPAIGDPVDFDDISGGWKLLAGMQGMDMTPQIIDTSDRPGGDGSLFLGARAGTNEVMVPVRLRAGSQAELRARRRNLLGRLSARHGLGSLEVVTATSRRILRDAYYVDGARGDTGADQFGVWWQKYGLIFRSGRPFPEDVDVTGETYELPTAGPFWPIWPWQWYSERIFGLVDITNTGDADAYPTWVANGACDAVTLTRMDTGQSLKISRPMTSGQYVTVDTRPGVETVVDETGANAWPFMDEYADLWTLPPGTTTINVDVQNAQPGSFVDLSYFRRFESLY